MAWNYSTSNTPWGLPDEETASLKHYFVYRGLYSTARAFDNELKQDKEKAFRVDKIMDQILHYVATYDIIGLRDYWNVLETRVFSSMDVNLAQNVAILQKGVLRYYVSHAYQQGKSEKVVEFFDKMSADLSGNVEWKEWFMIPFLKSVEGQSAFEMYFNKSWQETLLLSLHNFLCLALSSMKKPAILDFMEDRRKIGILELENASLKKRIEELSKKTSVEAPPASADKSSSVAGNSIGEWELMASTDVVAANCLELLDDFCEINAQKKAEPEQGSASSAPLMSISSFFKNFTSSNSTGASSPRYRSIHSQSLGISVDSAAGAGGDVQGSPRNKTSLSGSPAVSAAIETDAVDKSQIPTSHVVSPGHQDPAEANSSQSLQPKIQTPSSKATSYAITSQETYAEHAAPIVTCRFSATGNNVASLDSEGILKVWSCSSSPKTLFGTSRSVVTTLEWHPSEKYVLLGSKVGDIRLLDVKEKKVVKEAHVDVNFPKLASIATNPDGSSFVTSSLGRVVSNASLNRTNQIRLGLLTLWDLNSEIRLKRFLPLSPGPVAINCMAYNGSGNMLLTGGADGRIRIFDLRIQNSVADWFGHDCDISTVSFASVKTGACFSFAADGSMIQWSLQMIGQKVGQYDLESSCKAPCGVGNVGRTFALNASCSQVFVGWHYTAAIYKLKPKFEVIRNVIEAPTDAVTCVDWSDTPSTSACLIGTQTGSIITTCLNQNTYFVNRSNGVA